MKLPSGMKKYWNVPSEIQFEKDENGNVKRDESGCKIPKLDKNGNPVLVPLRDNRYLFRYIAEKTDTYCHLQLNQAGMEQWIGNPLWQCRPCRPDRSDNPFEFTVQSVHLYCFRTKVGILSFQIHLDTPDPLTAANQLYHLKNVENPQLFRDNSEPFSLVSLSRKLSQYSDLNINSDDFFFFAQTGTARANILTHFEVPAKCPRRKTLYYLRWCYTTSMTYSPNNYNDRREIYVQSKNILWGISPEAAVCLTIPELGNEEFIHGTFARSFNTAYLYTYILLLHQKYVLYKFMTDIDSNKIQLLKLEEYQMDLSKFENDFVYSRISEVAQYQNFYRRVSRIFSLRDMYIDVHEPLTELKDIQESDSDRNVNKALGLLAILAIFSALVDSFQFVEEVSDIEENSSGVLIFQILCISIIAIVSFFVIKTMWSSYLRQIWHDHILRKRL